MTTYIYIYTCILSMHLYKILSLIYYKFFNFQMTMDVFLNNLKKLNN